ncbi:MAG TPA: SAM-dependent methyltransferase [Pseudonocardiaceae bacterium]|jgi:O-methyltransferase involved in polyketide biosynthesis
MTLSPDAGRTGPQLVASWAPAASDYVAALPATWRVQARLLDHRYPSRQAEQPLVNQILTGLPQASALALEHRGFRTRAIRAVLEAGVRQFVDIGTGLATHDPIHELIAGNPDSRVVYTDIDPIAVGRIRVEIGDMLGAAPPQARVQQGSFAHPATVLRGPAAQGFLNPRQPICLVLTGLLEYCADEWDPAAIIAFYRRHLAPGSMLILTQPTIDGLDSADPAHQCLADGARTAAACFNVTATPLVLRGRAEFARFTAGLDLLGDGISTTTTCLNPHPPAEDPALALCLAAVGRVQS